MSSHIPLKDAAAASVAGTDAARLIYRALQASGVPEPRVAVAAFNPHGGDGGTCGREEVDIIAPAVRELNQEGVPVQGPFPADTIFLKAQAGEFQAIVTMYHDQARSRSSCWVFARRDGAGRAAYSHHDARPWHRSDIAGQAGERRGHVAGLQRGSPHALYTRRAPPRPEPVFRHPARSARPPHTLGIPHENQIRARPRLRMDRQDRAAARQFRSNAMDLLYSPQETMSTFRFHGWTVVEIETDDGIVGWATWRWRRASPRPSSTSTWRRWSSATTRGLRIPVAAHVSRHPCLGPQGRPWRRSRRWTWRSGTSWASPWASRCSLRAGAPRRRFPATTQALSRRSGRHAARGPDPSGPGLSRLQDALRLRAGDLQHGVTENPKSVEAVREVIGWI